MLCSFCGSSKCNTVVLHAEMEFEIEKLILSGVDEFYNGGYGDFDFLALDIVSKIKNKFPHIKSCIVLAYRTEQYCNRFASIAKHYQAETFYPFESAVLPRFAILKRNEYMVNNSDFVISHAGFGGSLTTLEYAIKKKKHIIYM